MTHQDPHSKSADAVGTDRPVEAQYVRQGRGGRRILMLLIVSAGAAAVLLLGLWAMNNASLHETAEETSMTPEAPPIVNTAPAGLSAGPETTPPPVDGSPPA